MFYLCFITLDGIKDILPAVRLLSDMIIVIKSILADFVRLI